jgi:exopolysaccharide biosynthesis polyprenyl glycosylphosphotransferase
VDPVNETFGADTDVYRVPDAQSDLRPARASSTISRYRRISAALIAADVLCILGALVIVHWERAAASGETRALVLVMLLSPILWVATFHSFGLYGIRHLSAPEEFRRLIAATTIAVLLIVVVSAWWDEALHRSSLALLWGTALLLELVVRRVARWHIRRQKRLGRLTLRTLIVGTNVEAETIADALAPAVRGFTPLGYVGSTPIRPLGSSLPLLGPLEELPWAIRDAGAECVFVASSDASPDEVVRVGRWCREADIEMRVSANAPEVLSTRLSIQQVHNLMMLTVRPAKLTGPQSALKRSFDVVTSVFLMIVLSPVMGAIALAIKLSSRGSVLFRQERVTKDGRTFVMNKFRTMVRDPQFAVADAVIDLTKPYFKLADDPRLTSVGRFLRAFSLDELPQLWNVARGDMSLVGPRPLPVEQVEANPELLGQRHEVRAGMTGWWQISGRSEVSVEEALRMDLFYIENWSLTYELFILGKTIPVLLSRRGAY